MGSEKDDGVIVVKRIPCQVTSTHNVPSFQCQKPLSLFKHTLDVPEAGKPRTPKVPPLLATLAYLQSTHFYKTIEPHYSHDPTS